MRIQYVYISDAQSSSRRASVSVTSSMTSSTFFSANAARMFALIFSSSSFAGAKVRFAMIDERLMAMTVQL